MSTHRPHPTDWVQAVDWNGYPIHGQLTYVGPTTGWYMAPRWSEAESFGEEEGDEPVNGVYIIRAVESGRLKIGQSSNVYKRLQSLRTGSPERLELVCVLDTSEAYAHHLARDFRLHGEWFMEEAFDSLAEIPRL